MKNLETGQFYGQTNQIVQLAGITLTDTEYTHTRVDWHYHENAYFTFILEGSVMEGNKKDFYHLSAGNLLFHNWQEAHYNIKPDGYTRGFHIELDQAWARSLEIDLFSVEGSIHILNPQIRILMHRIVKEIKIDDATSGLAIHSLLIDILVKMACTEKSAHKKAPPWVKQLKNMLHDTLSTEWTLTDLSITLGIHPVHLSREFPKYFYCTLGEYIRKIKVERSLSLLLHKNLSLTEIAFMCGFSDQSHFIRCFKAFTYTNPSQYRRLLMK